MASYYISGVWKDDDGDIISVLLHREIDNDTISNGVKRSKNYMINLLKADYVYTLIWNYKDNTWNVGQEVDVVHENSGYYLRTKGDNSKADNLDNMLPMDALT